MRKFLLASVAALGTGGLIGTAVAQTPVVGAPTQGQTAFPLANPPAGANNNNNYQAPALPGVGRKPYAGHHRDPRQRQGDDPVAGELGQPGYALRHGASRLHRGSADNGHRPRRRRHRHHPATPAATILGNNGTGTAKVAPYALDN